MDGDSFCPELCSLWCFRSLSLTNNQSQAIQKSGLKKVSVSVSKNFVSKKVSVSVSKTFGLEKKTRYRSRKRLVSKKSLGIGLEKIWSPKKVSVSKIFGLKKKSQPRSRKKVSVSVSMKYFGLVTQWIKLVQKLLKSVQTCSNLFKCAQTCLKLVQICSSMFNCVPPYSKLIQVRCNKVILQHSCKTDVPWWRDVHMNTFIHSPVSPSLFDIASYNQFHLAVTYKLQITN